MCRFINNILRLNYRNKQFSQYIFYSSQPNQDVQKQNLPKVVNVAIIGAPNAGKSTLINSLVQRKVCAVSSKVHTTTKMSRAMFFENNTQVIFLDTPGVVTEKEQKRYKLPEAMIEACYKSLRCADVIGVVHDIANTYTKDKINHDVLKMLKLVDDIPSFLIINKIDQLKCKKQLLSTIRNLTNGLIAGIPIPGPQNKRIKSAEEEKGYGKFSDVFLVSTLKGDGVNDVKGYLLNNAKPASLQYGPAEWSDQQPEKLIIEAVRAKFLDYLAQEIPYNLKIEMEYYDDNQENDKIVCSLSVECSTERLMRLISGAGGGRLNQIKTCVKNDLINLFRKPVTIDIHLTTRQKPKY